MIPFFKRTWITIVACVALTILCNYIALMYWSYTPAELPGTGFHILSAIAFLLYAFFYFHLSLNTLSSGNRAERTNGVNAALIAYYLLQSLATIEVIALVLMILQSRK